MLKSTLSGAIVALTATFGTHAMADSDTGVDIATPACTTLDGVNVRYAALPENDPLWFGASVASARYDENGAMIYYDQEIIERLSQYALLQILEHECAHHRLGHTLQTRNYRDAEASVPVRLTARKEKDADCEAVYIMAENYGVSRDQLGDAFREIYQILAGSDQLDPHTYARMVRAQECHDGFFQRPVPLNANELTP